LFVFFFFLLGRSTKKARTVSFTRLHVNTFD
jgi:hypothetical protein